MNITVEKTTKYHLSEEEVKTAITTALREITREPCYTVTLHPNGTACIEFKTITNE